MMAMGLGRLATALSAIYPGEEWACDAGRAVVANKMGLALSAEDIARCENGTELSMLIEHKRDARRIVMLDAALSWVGLSDEQAGGKMGNGSSYPHAQLADKEQDG